MFLQNTIGFFNYLTQIATKIIGARGATEKLIGTSISEYELQNRHMPQRYHTLLLISPRSVKNHFKTLMIYIGMIFNVLN